MNHAIPQNIFVEIQALVPNIKDNVNTLFYRDFVFNMHDLMHGGSLGIALVCLRDAYFRLDSAKISLYNAHVQFHWYEKFIDNAPLPLEAKIFSKYYLDYVPLLLYAFQEDISEFILNFNNKMTNFKNWKKLPSTVKLLDKKRISSNAGQTGLFLKEKHPKLNFTKGISKLILNEDWKKAINYRNSWVHKKPPIIEGLGVQHSRNSRIKRENGQKSFGFGGASEPDYTINELFDICTKSLEAAVELANDIISIVDDKSEQIKSDIKFS